MGLFSHMFGVSSVLFTDQRVEDVTEWYQSSSCSMGREDAMTKLMLQHLGLRGP